jgi:SPX domain protein involved in polyphosphate accumulation
MNSAEQQKNKTDFRFEKKFVASVNDLMFIENYIQSRGASPIYQPRWINNIYTDFDDMRSLHENMDGLSDRVKTRFRWYGETFGNIQITAEQKIKSDDVNRKNSIKLGTFNFSNNQETTQLFSEISERLLENDQDGLFWNVIQQHPTLINRYHRSYFMSLDNQVRITIDTELQYYNCQFETISQHDHIIIELKSPSENLISGDFLPLQLNKSSKYVEGMISTDPEFIW